MRNPRRRDGSKHKRAAQLPPSERRQQLLRCAVKVFAETGIGRANHALVAKAAGVAVPTVFAYFPNREALVDAVLAEVERRLLGIVKSQFEREDLTAYQKLLRLLSDYADCIDQDPELVKVFLDWTTSFQNDLARKFQAYLKKVLGLLKGMVEEGRDRREFGPEVNAEDVALIVFGSANVIAQIKFSNYQTDVSHYLISLITGALHLQNRELPHGAAQPAGARKAALRFRQPASE